MRPDILLAPSELARLLLMAIVVFWIARLVIQPLLFDRVMRVGWTRSSLVRVGAHLVWMIYIAIYSAALLEQFRAADYR